MAKKITKRRVRRQVVPGKCYFCEQGKTPVYSDVEVLNRHITERGKILGRARTGLCAIHQRRLASAIKHARHLALMPFLVRE